MKTSTGAAVGSAGFAFAVVTILVWLAGLRGITVPDGVAVAISTIISMVMHVLVARFPILGAVEGVYPMPVSVPTTAAPATPSDEIVARSAAIRDQLEKAGVIKPNPPAQIG